MNPTALALILVAGLVVYLGFAGKLGSVWSAMRGEGAAAPAGNLKGSQPSAPSIPSVPR